LQLSNLRYAAFGLGNSNYKYYNRVVDVVAERLENAGANRILPIGRADDCSGGTEEDFLSWKEELFNAFTSKLGYHEREVPYTPTLAIVKDTSIPPSEVHQGTPFDKVDGNKKKTAKTSPIKALPISNVYKLYNSPRRNCIHLEMELGNHNELRYKTGDHLIVYPSNPDAEVSILLHALGLENSSSTPLQISSVEEGVAARLPSPTTAEALFRYYLEVCALVSRDTVRDLAQFAPTQEAKALLLLLGKDKESYANFIRKNHVTLGRLLAISAPGAVWTDLPLSYLLETIMLLQPRYYSISSSSVVSARRLAITVGIESTPLAEEPTTEIHGLTSNYLLSLAHSLESPQLSPLEPRNEPKYTLSGPDSALQGHKVFAAIRRSKFKLPALGSTPLIMVAAGTGLAPFRGFIQERARLKTVGQPVGRMLLFFGCRHPDEDFLYREELSECATVLEGSLEIVTAFSRVNDKPKKYVQDQMKTRANEICELLDQGAGLYICGRAAMAREVGNELRGMMMTQYGWDQVRLSEWSEAMKRGNKWLEDVWG
jgi:NADPH-ferrihemoprotein reductase